MYLNSLEIEKKQNKNSETQKKVIIVKSQYNVLINFNIFKKKIDFENFNNFENVKIIFFNKSKISSKIQKSNLSQKIDEDIKIENDYKNFLGDKKNFKIKKNDFFFLKKFFYFLFFDGKFNKEIFKKFTFLDRFVMSKFVSNKIDNENIFLNLENLKKKIFEKFLAEKKKEKGFKITNTKRFIFRKIKNILFKKFKKEKKDISHFLIIKYYFFNKNDKNLKFEKKDFLKYKKFLNDFKKLEIIEISKSKKFVKDFMIIFKKKNFLKEMKKFYYQKKIDEIFFYLENLKIRKFLNFNNIMLPWKEIPYSHKSILKFRDNFEKSYKKFFFYY